MHDHQTRENRWLDIMAHDLKTPIGAVRGAIEMVEMAGPLNERQLRFAEVALGGLKRIEVLVERMLDMAWVDGEMPLNLTECPIDTLIYSTVHLLENLAAERGIRIDVDVPDDLYRVTGDYERLTQVFENLLGNAIRYHHEAGRVWLRAVNNGDGVQVSVRDDGPGIAWQDQPRVFEAFYRTRDQARREIPGTGLGLTISRMIVLRHGGQLWFESAPGRGSEFIFYLPREFGQGADRVPAEALAARDVPRIAGEEGNRPGPGAVEGAGERPDPVNDDLQESRDATAADKHREDSFGEPATR